MILKQDILKCFKILSVPQTLVVLVGADLHQFSYMAIGYLYRLVFSCMKLMSGPNVNIPQIVVRFSSYERTMCKPSVHQ